MTPAVGLARHVSGAGDPVVLVHGTSADHRTFRFVAPLLDPHHTVVAVDRRGYLTSPDAAPYRLHDEFDDLAAVMYDLGGRPAVLGHSFGATVALGAAIAGAPVGPMVLYEPPLPEAITPELINDLTALGAADDRAAILELVLRRFAGLDDSGVADFRASDLWQQRLVTAQSVVRELVALSMWQPGDLAAVTMPVTVLVGGRSAAPDRARWHALADALPHARMQVMPDEGHVATATSPDLVAGALLTLTGA